MTPAAAPASGNAYNIFILVLTAASLLIMVLLWLPFSAAALDLLRAYDNAICVVFLVDFGLALRRAPSKRGYLLAGHGWLDLLGSLPALPGFAAVGLLRMARLSRLTRILRRLRRQDRRQLVADVLRNRAEYASVVTALAAFFVLATASLVVLDAESRSATANIATGWDAFWWAAVTITTVGYGDRYSTTVVGRIGALFVMVMGVGIIGSLASLLASLLVSPAADPAASPRAATGAGALALPDAPEDLAGELAALRGELAGVRRELAALRRAADGLDGRTGAAASPLTRPPDAPLGAEGTTPAPPADTGASP